MIPDNKILELRGALERSGFRENGNSNELRGNSPYRPGSDSHGFVVWLPGSGSGKIGTFDHATNENGTLITLADHYNIHDFEIGTAPARATYHANPEYIYHNEQGDPIYKVVRLDDKKGFPQYHMCSAGEWVSGLGGNAARCECDKVEKSLYRLPELMAAGAGSTVIICEGEKDVHTAEMLGYVATCNSGGANAWRHVPSRLYAHFSGKHVVVISDNDTAGDRHTSDVIQSLRGRCLSIKTFKFDGIDGYDLTDWANDGGAAGGLRSRINETLDIANLNIPPQPISVPTSNSLLDFPAADEGNAQSVFQLYGGQFLYTDEVGWLHYTGSHWAAKGAEAELTRAIVDTLIQRRAQAVKAEIEPIVKTTKPTAGNVKNAKFLFQSIVWTDFSSFDVDKNSLNCTNGVVSLNDGEQIPHDSDQRFTYCIDTEYDPDADYSQWEEWLFEAITPDDFTGDEAKYIELADWLQMAVGYSLTGHTHEQCLFFLHGPPRAGKGIFLQTLDSLLGKPLSSGVDFDTFTGQRTADNQNFDLANLKACRLITATESDRTSMLNAKRVKSITGNDPVYCAHKRKDFFSYTPQYKIWLSSNFKIVAAPDDKALWSRLRVVYFPNSYLGKEDLWLSEKLWADRAGILKWCVEGAKRWYERKDKNIGLGQPEIIKTEAATHQAENDTVQMFIDDCCIIGEDRTTLGKLMTSEYKNWCNENGVKPFGVRRLAESLRSKNFQYKAKRVGLKTQKSWVGLGIEA